MSKSRPFPEFLIDLPAKWTNQTSYLLMGPQDTGAPVAMAVTLDRQIQDDDLESFARIRIDMLSESMGGFETVKEGIAELPSGREAYEIVYKWIPSEDTVVFRKYVYLIMDDVGFTFTGDFTKKTLKTVGVEMMQIIDSLRSVE